MECGRYAFSDGRGTLVSACVRPRRPDETIPAPQAGGPSGVLRTDPDPARPARIAFLSLRKPCECVKLSVAFVAALAERLCELTEGLIYDMDGCRQYAPGQMAPRTPLAALDGFRHVSYHAEKEQPGTLWLHSHGLIKFGRPELELFGVPAERKVEASMVLFYLSQGVLDGTVLKPGDVVGPETMPLKIGPGRNPGGHYDVPVLELRHGAEGDPARFGLAASGIQDWFHEKYEIDDGMLSGGMFSGR
jgi:hypothetical protein